MAAGLSKTVLQMKLEQKINTQSELTGWCDSVVEKSFAF